MTAVAYTTRNTHTDTTHAHIVTYMHMHTHTTYQKVCQEQRERDLSARHTHMNLKLMSSSTSTHCFCCPFHTLFFLQLACERHDTPRTTVKRMRRTRTRERRTDLVTWNDIGTLIVLLHAWRTWRSVASYYLTRGLLSLPATLLSCRH